jgi:hypothetical protein
MRFPRRAPRWHVPAPAYDRTDRSWRVTARLGSDDIFIEADRPLAANADAIAAQLALPGFAAGASLGIDADLDATLDENLQHVREVGARYWNLPGGTITPAAISSRAPEGEPGMFFTGGVDSHYTLFRRRTEIRCVVFVHGFDIPLEDRPRMENAAAGVKNTAAALSLEALFPRTNLRASRWFRALPWETTHVAALAAVAHALAPVLSRVYVAATDVPAPYGSSPELDPLWSSGAVEIINDGGDTPRLDKVRAIAEWTAVHDGLRVCWENRSAALNCGVCEKCLRTQAQFAAAGALGRLRVFPPGRLAPGIDALPTVTPTLSRQWRAVRAAIDDTAIAASIDRLLARSASAAPRRRWPF